MFLRRYVSPGFPGGAANEAVGCNVKTTRMNFSGRVTRPMVRNQGYRPAFYKILRGLGDSMQKGRSGSNIARSRMDTGGLSKAGNIP